MQDKIHIPTSFLSSGKDFQISKSLIVKHPTVQEIFDLDKENNGFFSEDLYYSYVSIFICDPYSYMVYLDDKKIDYESVSSFDLFIMLYKDMVEKYENDYGCNFNGREFDAQFMDNPYFKAFKFFLNKDYFMLAKDENGQMVIGDPGTNTVMVDKDRFLLISEFIKKINGIQEIDKIIPDDDFAKQILIEDERASIKKKARQSTEEKEVNRLGNLLSCVTWGSNGGINPFNRNNLHIYDLIDGVNRNDKIFNYDHTITGIYSGCIDSDKINMQKISWCN